MDDSIAKRQVPDTQQRRYDMPIARSRQGKNRLRAEREHRGWSREYVATKIGSDMQSLGRWERGTTSPSPFYRQALCELFGMNAIELGLLKDGLQEPAIGQEREEYSMVEERREEPSIAGMPPFIAPASNERLGQPMFSSYHPYSQAQLVVSFRGLLSIIALSVIVVLLCAPGFMIVAERVMPLTFATNVRSNIKPGGLWVLPVNGQQVGETLSFAAKAYPTNPGDPVINHVNFTIGWQNGGWRIGCVAYFPTSDAIYACTVILASLNAPPGNLRISFDVYDQQGNINFAPNGIHSVVYAP